MPAVEEPPYESVRDRWGKPLFSSLWVRAWGDHYPVDVQPFSSCTRELLDQLVREAELGPGKVLADLGCGTGGVGLWLARESGARLVGIDRSPGAIEIAKQRMPDWQLDAPAEFVQAEFANTGLNGGSVDAAISVDALPFASDVDAAFRETHRILRPGGRFVFTTREARVGTERARNLGTAWRYALERCGFELLHSVDRPEVPNLWHRLYAQWVEHEVQLRTELLDETVDGMLAEVGKVGPTLDDGRAWPLITAVKAC